MVKEVKSVHSLYFLVAKNLNYVALTTVYLHTYIQTQLYLNVFLDMCVCVYVSAWIQACTYNISVQFSSVSQSCLTLCDPMNCSTPGLPVHHQLLEFTQTYAHRVSDAIQPFHPRLSPSFPAPNPSQHQGLFQWVSFSREVAKVLEFQLQHQSFQWTPRTDLL